MIHVLFLVDTTPLIWYTERQKTVATSTYGSELVAARIGTEMVIEVEYKLKMLGMGLERTSLIIGDNMSVILNITHPSSMLKKKHIAVAYHRVKETIAFKVMYFCHLPSTANVVDILTKHLSSQIFHDLLKQYLYRKAKVHEKAQNITATLVGRIISVTMSEFEEVAAFQKHYALVPGE